MIGRRGIVVVALAAAGLGAAVALSLDPRDLVRPRSVSVFADFFGAAVRPTLVSSTGHSLVPTVATAIRETLVFAVAGLSLAIVIGGALGFLSCRAWHEGFPPRARRGFAALTAVARGVSALMRSVHELLWALLFLAAFGLSPIAAAIAIAIPFGGTLAKVWSELLDEAPRDSSDALRAIGGGPAAAFVVALVPRAIADIGSYAFYRLECAVRSSAVMGFLGIPTLGYHVSLSFDNLLYRETWTFLYALILLVVALEGWSLALRRRRRSWA